MDASEDAELTGWAEQEGITKSTLLHNMIGRERRRRNLQGQNESEIDLSAGYVESTLMGGVIWRGNDLAGTDAGYTRIKEFIK